MGDFFDPPSKEEHAIGLVKSITHQCELLLAPDVIEALKDADFQIMTKLIQALARLGIIVLDRVKEWDNE